MLPWLTTVRRFLQSSATSAGCATLKQARTYRSILTVGAVTMASVVAVCVAMAVVAAVTTPAAVPVAIAGTVLSKAAELFGSGDGDKHLSGTDIATAGDGAQIDCQPVPAPSTVTSTPIVAPPTSPVPDDVGEIEDEAGTEEPASAAMSPIEIGTNGSMSHDDAKKLIDPVPPKTSALTAHVWFLYRLAGLGDWDTFIAAYRDKGLRDDDEAENAPLVQVQALNSSGAQMERYRLTAASLSLSGLYTGRFDDPYPEYRELLSTELLSTCFANSELADQRMTLPPATVTSSVPELESTEPEPEPQPN